MLWRRIKRTNNLWHIIYGTCYNATLVGAVSFLIPTPTRYYDKVASLFLPTPTHEAMLMWVGRGRHVARKIMGH